MPEVEGFSAAIQQHLRASGYKQQELAKALNIHPKVFSRKLHRTGSAYFTHLEIRRLLIILARWQVITTREDILQLLELAQVDATILSINDWQTPPLNTLSRQDFSAESFNGTRPTVLTILSHNLPAPTTRLIGRNWAIRHLQYLLKRDDVRLITLVGAGGSGKTRLALHVAHEKVSEFAQGVWLVSLAGVHDPNLVPMNIIQALRLKSSPDVSPLQSLLTYLRDKQMLLLLDNFEQVGAAASVVTEMLEAAPALKILITSRTVLHLYGEHELGVPPLDFPDPTLNVPATELANYEAIQLFVERAQAVQRNFMLTDENAATVMQICAKSDGLPLALELAAARIKVLTPQELLDLLTKARLSVLVGGAKNRPDRQRTLRDTIEWSYNLLSTGKQAYFRRLGIFVGGWSLADAEAMLEGIPVNGVDTPEACNALDLLAQFIDDSLCIRQPSVEKRARFTMLETLREYALEQLARHGELELLQDWHTSYFLREVEAAEFGLRGPQQREWLIRLMVSRQNIQIALEWSLQKARAGQTISTAFLCEQAPIAARAQVGGSLTLSTQKPPEVAMHASEVCLRLASAFRPYWEWQGYLQEGGKWLKDALEIPLAKDVGQAARAKALSEAARLLCLQNEQQAALKLAEASSALWLELDDPIGLGFAQLHKGWVGQSQHDYEMAQQAYKTGLSRLSPVTSPWIYAQLLFHLADATGFTSRYDEMRMYYAQSLEIFERVGDKSSRADLLKDQGGMLILEGRPTEAIDYLVRSLKLCHELGHKQFIATGMNWLIFAVGLSMKPDPVTASHYAAQFKGITDKFMDEIGLNPWTRTDEFLQQILLHIRSHTSEESWEAALASGKALTIEQAIELAQQMGELR